MYRFRILNASISRSYRFRLSTGDPVTVVATDGGLMPVAQQVASWRHAGAERYEVLVDFTKYAPGTRVELRNLSNPNNVDYLHTGKVMAFDVTDEPVTTTRPDGTPDPTWVLAVRIFAVGWYPASSDSMAPTIDPGDRVVVDKLAWRLGELGRGDLVTFPSPVDGERLVKRVVAVAGDTVALEDAVLVVNGRPVRERYVDHSRIDGTYFGPVTVPPRHLFVLGDNRFGSIDSRVYGPIPLDAVTGGCSRSWADRRRSAPCR